MSGYSGLPEPELQITAPMRHHARSLCIVMRSIRQAETMIKLTRLNNTLIVVNSDLIEFVETTPDTIITLTTGKKVIVRESVDEVIDKVIEYKKRVFSGLSVNKR